MVGYRVYQFCGGRKEVVVGSWTTADAARSRVFGRRSEFGVSAEILETELIIKPNPPSQRSRTHRVTHTLVKLERERPNAVFVCVISEDDFKRLGKIADRSKERLDADIRSQIQALSARPSKAITIKDLPPQLKNRITENKKGCWIWSTQDKAAPYRKVYVQLGNKIPKNAMLRHDCDNPLCVNPLHLNPGTAKQNSEDMLSRGRHWRQQKAKKKAANRERHLRRKTTRA